MNERDIDFQTPNKSMVETVHTYCPKETAINLMIHNRGQEN